MEVASKMFQLTIRDDHAACIKDTYNQIVSDLSKACGC